MWVFTNRFSIADHQLFIRNGWSSKMVETLIKKDKNSSKEKDVSKATMKMTKKQVI
jgi:hypothetical protein